MVRKRLLKDDATRIDSGAAMSSDPVAPSGGSRIVEMPEVSGDGASPKMPTVLGNSAAPKRSLRKDDLKLKQPKGFPIILMPSTLARARKEAENGTENVFHTPEFFKVFEDAELEDDLSDGEEGDGASGEDDVETGEEEKHDAGEEESALEEGDEHEAEGEEDDEKDAGDDNDAGDEDNSEFEYGDENDHNDKNDYYDQASTAKLISAPVTRKPLAIVDRLGRTRAAARRLQAALEGEQPADAQTTPSVCDEEDKAAGTNKRKRGVTQASKEPRKTQIREVQNSTDEKGRRVDVSV
ncbi:hypothetical protein PtrSN002B_008651 [Pyrenophora tritici-repentis]|nr:Nop14 domain-containing protein [Pyrenophora tritici-repentis]KAI1524931.1 hypothetical protein PtrSN001C_010845 [Pyrenophora tritici-repentis]KAI1540570.1 hypothetical protein PtrSN002B_008651 [Pyrenophora tritici-repentis]KAI1562639.1 hypothetical protein PtrEW7m1_010867 [Pyrenophora tritici-repentis]KAI1564379.1 hypothetical protein PtrEW4_008875 [Pyrenophora tritici-repentis]